MKYFVYTVIENRVRGTSSEHWNCFPSYTAVEDHKWETEARYADEMHSCDVTIYDIDDMADKNLDELPGIPLRMLKLVFDHIGELNKLTETE